MLMRGWFENAFPEVSAGRYLCRLGFLGNFIVELQTRERLIRLYQAAFVLYLLFLFSSALIFSVIDDPDQGMTGNDLAFFFCGIVFISLIIMLITRFLVRDSERSNDERFLPKKTSWWRLDARTWTARLPGWVVAGGAILFCLRAGGWLMGMALLIDGSRMPTVGMMVDGFAWILLAWIFISELVRRARTP